MDMAYKTYNKQLKEFSRDLRNHSTFAEVLLWMQKMKLKILRVRDEDVKTDMQNVIQAIEKFMDEFEGKNINTAE